MDIVEPEPALVADPERVDRLVLARGLAVDRLLAAADERVATRGTAGAKAFRFLEEPDAHLKAEILARERADGTDIDRVERVIIIEPLSRMDRERGVAAAFREAEHIVVDRLLGKTDATRAHDAALVVQHDALADVHPLRLLDLLLDETAVIVAVLDRVFLQLALAGLVADRAVERMIDEEEFHHALAAFVDQRRRGANGRAFAHLRGAADGGARNPVDFRLAVGIEHWRARGVHLGSARLDKAHAAVARDGELGVIAVMGNELAHTPRNLDGVEPLGKLHPDAVDLNIDQRRVGGRRIVIEWIFHAAPKI